MNIKPIPNTLGFLVSDTGVVTDASGNVRNQYTNGDGYKTASVKMSDGSWVTFGVQRLVALAHIPCPGLADEYVVNHKDGNIENNNVDNLEWISNTLNIIHASLLRGSEYRNLILADNGEEKKFLADLEAASIHFNCDKNTIWECIKNNKPLNGWKLIHHSSVCEIPDELKKPTGMVRGRVGKIENKSIKSLNLETKEIRHYESLHSAGKEFNVTASHVYQCISKNGSKKLFLRKFLICLEEDNFPDLDEIEYRRLLGPTGKRVIAYNVETKKYFIFESASKFINRNNLSKKAVTVDLKKDRIRQNGNWLYLYMNNVNVKRLTAWVGCPETDLLA